LSNLPKEQSDKVRGFIADKNELERLCNGKHNVLQIKQMLDTQSPNKSGLDAIIAFVELLQSVGLVTLAK